MLSSKVTTDYTRTVAHRGNLKMALLAGNQHQQVTSAVATVLIHVGQALLLPLSTEMTKTELAIMYFDPRAACGTCTTYPMGEVSPNLDKGGRGLVFFIV